MREMERRIVDKIQNTIEEKFQQFVDETEDIMRTKEQKKPHIVEPQRDPSDWEASDYEKKL